MGDGGERWLACRMRISRAPPMTMENAKQSTARIHAFAMALMGTYAEPGADTRMCRADSTRVLSGVWVSRGVQGGGVGGGGFGQRGREFSSVGEGGGGLVET